jgi:hypothetical protein
MFDCNCFLPVLCSLSGVFLSFLKGTQSRVVPLLSGHTAASLR